MPGPKAPTITLTEEAEQELTRLIRRHSTPQQVALRARIVVAAAADKSNSQIAREEAVDVSTIRRWRNRWLNLEPIPLKDLSAEERLEDLPRSGAPARITPDQVCKVIALACEPPKDADRPISHWTAREIADEIQQRGIIDEISPRHAARLFKRGHYQAASNALLADESAG